MRLILAATAAFALSACGNSDTTYHPPEYHPPKFEEPKFDPSKLKIDPADLSRLREMMTCNEPPKESDLTPEVKAKPLNIHETIERQDVESVGCDNRKTFESKKAQNTFEPILRIEPPSSLNVKASSASIENLTTCVTRKVDHTAKIDQKDAEAKRREKIMWILNPASIDDQNVIQIKLNNTTLKATLRSLNVVKGQNLLKVTYKNSAAEEIAHTQVLVNVDIEEHDLPGVKQVNVCKK